MMEIRELTPLEKAAALSLVWDIFLEFEAPDYSAEGVQTFHNFIGNKEAMDGLVMYGAFQKEVLTGVIATRNKGNHISLFFVHSQFHRQGIGTHLFREVIKRSSSEKITVNSSPYAVEVYHKLGFTDTDSEQLTDGMRYTPMEYISDFR